MGIESSEKIDGFENILGNDHISTYVSPYFSEYDLRHTMGRSLLRYSSVRGVNKWERIWYTWYLYWTECKRVYKGTENWRDWRLIDLIAHGPKFWRERRKNGRGKEERGVATWGGGGSSLSTLFPRGTPGWDVIFIPRPGAQSHDEENPGFLHFLLIQLHIMILQLRVLQQRKIHCKQ